MSFTDILDNAARNYNISLSNDQLKDFVVYKDLLLEWNKKMNLTAITDENEVAVKHMIDSLTCYDSRFFQKNCSVIDVGTGAGFPGIPLKIVRPDLNITLLDSLNKRLIFLQELIKILNLKDVKVVHARAEEAGHSSVHRESYQIVISRAVARMSVLAEYCLPLVKIGGYFIALKGSKGKDETTEAAKAIKILGGTVLEMRPIQLPGYEDSRTIIFVHKEKCSPIQYPRRAGLPEKKPLV